MRARGVILAACLGALLPTTPADAAVHEVSVGNYYFEEDATGARNPIVVDEGDQIRFTIRQAAYPPHSVVIDEYDIDSGQLLISQTYTTKPLNIPGTFKLYCRAHERRGHATTLVVQEAAAPASDPSEPEPETSGGGQPAPNKKAKASPGVTPQTTTSPGSGAPSPTAAGTTAPVGVGRATDPREVEHEADSLAGLLGRDFGGDVPWTAAVWQWALAALPIAAATGYAIRRERARSARAR